MIIISKEPDVEPVKINGLRNNDIVTTEQFIELIHYISTSINRLSNSVAEQEYKELINGLPELPKEFVLKLNSSRLCIIYTYYVIKERWSEAEIILRNQAKIKNGCIDNICDVIYYIENVIKGRWLEIEDIIKVNGVYIDWYCQTIIHGRWIEAEEILKQYPSVWKMYQKRYRIK